MGAPREPGALERLRRLEQDDLARRAPAGDGGAVPGASRRAARKRGVLGGIVAALTLLLVKGKGLLLLAGSKAGVLLSALKLGKLAATLGTMGLSFMFYMRYYGWSFALGLVVLILVHEVGHGIAAMRLGLKVGAPIFIPGFGAVIALKDQPRSTWASAVVGYGGPLAGTLGGVSVLLGGRLLLGAGNAGLANALAHFTFLMNFFNLLPVAGLDGDRISEPLRRAHWLLGLGLTAAVALFAAAGSESGRESTNPQIVFALAIIVLGAIKAFRAHRREAAAKAREPGRLVDQVVGARAAYTEEAGVAPWQRRAAGIAYFGLVALLSWLSLLTEPPAR